MLTHQIGPAQVRDLEPWHADELAEFFRRSGADLYEWLPEPTESALAANHSAHGEYGLLCSQPR